MIRFFRHYFSAVYVGLFFIESLLFFFSLYFAVHIRFVFSHNQFTENYLLGASVCFAAILSFCCLVFGMYRRSLGWNDFQLIPRISLTFLAAIIFIVSLFYIFPELLVGRGILFFSISFAYIGMIAIRQYFFRYTKKESLKRRILIIGCGKNAEKIISSNMDHIFRGFEVIGCLPLSTEESVAINSKLLIRSTDTIPEIVKRLSIDEIVIATRNRRHKNLPIKELLDCKMSGVEVLDLLTFYEREKAYIDLDNLNPSWLVFSDGFMQSVTKLLTKRLFDIVASILLLLVTWPTMLLTALAIYLESGIKEPVFYRQTRVGENDTEFDVIKFRSMKTDAELHGAQFATDNDDRVTRVGGFIRKARIDELPQLYNVLKGEMSFVGPRPERPEFVEGFKKINYYAERHRVKPGITGWAQLCYPYGAGEYDAVQKLQYDLYYIKNYSLLLDLIIMVHTVEVILWGKGSR